MNQNGSNTKPPERPVTRIFAFVIGLSFILVPLLFPLNLFPLNSSQRHEIATAGPGMLVFFCYLYASSEAIGALFLYVAIRGKPPLWISRCDR